MQKIRGFWAGERSWPTFGGVPAEAARQFVGTPPNPIEQEFRIPIVMDPKIPISEGLTCLWQADGSLAN